MEIVREKKEKVVRHKVTTEVYKKIKAIAEAMMPCSKLNAQGLPQMRRVTKRCTWKTMQPQNRAHIEKNNPKNANLKGYYKEIWLEPILIDHKECLIAEYKMHGDAGIEFYVKAINSQLEKEKEKENENSNTNPGQE